MSARTQDENIALITKLRHEILDRMDAYESLRAENARLQEALNQIHGRALRLALRLDEDNEAQPSHGRAAREIETDARAALAKGGE